MKSRVAVFIFFIAFLMDSFAINCNDINELASYGIIGENGFDYGNNSQINNQTISGSGNTPTPTGSVTTVNPSFPPLSPATFPSFSSSTNKKNVSTISAGTYNKIEIASNNLTTVFTAGTYYIKELILSKSNTTAQLAPGDYFIEKISMTSNSFITINPAGPVRIFIKDSIQAGNEIGINANGAVENLIIYLYSDASIDIGNGDQGHTNLNFNGIIYSPYDNTSIEFGNNNDIRGAILSAGEIDVGNNTYFDYSTAVESAVIGAFGCTVTSMVPIAEYRFDTLTPIDSSGNNLNGTINGGVTTNTPGQVCSAYRFNGTNAFVSVPDNNLLDKSKVSVSAWVRHTSNTFKNWEAILAKGDSAYRLHLNGGCSINTPRTNNGFSYGINSGCSTADIDSNIVPTTNQWYHVVGTYNGSTIKIYVDNILKASASYNGLITSNNFPLYIGANSQQAGRNWTGDIDEVKIFNGALTSQQIDTIYTNEKNGLRWDGTPGCQIVTPNPIFTFDAWDSFRSISDRNISTKIVGKDFTLTVASLNEANTALQDFNGTVCAQLIDTAGNALTGWNKILFSSNQSASTTFTLNRAIGGSDSAGVRLLWEKDAPAAAACDALTDTNTTIASDRFAVRPASFALSVPNAVAGVDFNMSFSAPNFSGTPSDAYNESVPGSFDVSIAEHNPSCAMGVFNPVPSSFSFLNGSKIFTTRYSEVGVLDINITDLTKACNVRYAKVDCDDADVSGSYNSASDLPIGLTPAQITIKPHHFDVSGMLTDFDGGTFTYLSDDLAMSSALDLNITAKNGEGAITANYNGLCYAKNTTLTLPHSVVPAPLTKILYSETLSAIQSNTLKANPLILTFNADLFNSGSVQPNIDLNFDRSFSLPQNPFDFNITSATALDTDGVTGAGVPAGTAKFVYGRARAYDVTTNETSAPNPIEFEVYSTTSSGYVSGMPQNVLKWYRNLNHDTAAAGNVVRGGFSAGGNDIDTSIVPADGLQIVTVTSVHDQTIHLDISPWLWYSLNPLKTYNYGTDCTQHPCFNYDYTDAGIGVKGVNSGSFQGSDFQMTPAKNITNKGVKLFR